MLLEALTKWSLGQRTETQVSDIYVRLGNDFNVANVAFGSYGIDMSDLTSVPDDLRDCLERCLSEDASPQTLEVHLPRIREIIIGLLQGLKSKQAEYKQLLIQRRASARNSKSRNDTGALVPSSAIQPVDGSPHPKRVSSSVRSALRRVPNGEADGRDSSSETQPLPPQAVQLSDDGPSSESTPRPDITASNRSIVDPNPPARRNQQSIPSSHAEEHTSAESMQQEDVETVSATSETLSKETTLTDLGVQSKDDSLTPQPDAGLFHAAAQGQNDLASESMGEIGDAADPSVRALKNRDALERRASKRFSAYTFNKMGVGLNQGLGMSSYALGGTGSTMSSPALDRKETNGRTHSRRGLSRGSNDISMDARDGYSPSKTPTKSRAFTPAAEDTIHEGRPAAETPVRRKGHSRLSPRQSPRAPQAALVPPPAGTSHTNSSTESLPFVDAKSSSPPAEFGEQAHVLSEASSGIPPVPPLPPLPTSQEQAKSEATQARGATSRWGIPGRSASASQRRPSTSSSALHDSISLFLQLGRQTKRAIVDLDPKAPFKGLSTGKLRMLFMDKFSYSPGREDFPTIYVKDSHTGVSYELEDLSEVVDGTLLTLNIEPLDQVKQHLDLTLGTITRELRELKATVQERDRESTRRASANVYDHVPGMQTASRITDAQFAKAGARVAQYKRTTMFAPTFDEGDTTNALSSPTKGSSTGSVSDVGGRLAGDQLRKQYEEVIQVRRQLAIMAQMQDDFKTDVGGLLSGLREQSKRVRAIAATDVPTERQFIIAGKARLDTNSQEILTLVEDLLDSVDDLKADVIQRGVKPKPHTMKKLGAEIERATRGLEDVSKYVETVKPSWKKTWEMELQNIVDEQEFLNHQEGLISDLKEDHANLQDVFFNIQEVIKLRGANRFNLTANSQSSENALSNVALRTYIPPPPEEGHEGLSTVMMEVKSQNVDHEKRLKALQAAEKQRQRELRQRKTQEDDFQNELTTFVDGKALRKTGGYLETERIRHRRDKLTIQAMFGGGGVGGAPLDGGTPLAPPKKLNVAQKDPSDGSNQTSLAASIPNSTSDSGANVSEEG